MALLLHPEINKEQNLRGQYAVVWSDLALFCDFQKRQIADNQVCKFNSKKTPKGWLLAYGVRSATFFIFKK